MIKKNLLAIFILLSVILASFLIVISPSFISSSSTRTELNKELELELILDQNKNLEIVFFGYTNCPDICYPRLDSINKYYTELDKSLQNNIGVRFIDISVPDDKTLPQRYAEFFNPSFIGVYLNNSILREYTKAFSVFFSPSLFNKTEFEHTGNLYIVIKKDKKKYLRYIYNIYPYDFSQITNDITGLLNETY